MRPLRKLEEVIRQYRRLFVVVCTVTAVQIFELALLHYKYDIFSGGFLQPFSYRSFSERLLFVLLSFWFDTVFIGFAAALWFGVTDRLHRYGLIVYYNFMALVLLTMGLWLSFKFQVLSFFSDAINLQIVGNLGAGSLKEALLYASNEIGLFLALTALAAAALYVLVKLLQHSTFINRIFVNDVEHAPYGRMLAGATLLTAALIGIVAHNDFWRYGLDKKTSYHLLSRWLDRLTDIDRDGSGAFSFPPDSAPLNAAIHPGALDVPGNGKDEDGYLGDAQPPDPAGERDALALITPRPGKHIVLIVLESARAGLLTHKADGAYVAPHVRGVAATGAAIPYAYSHTGYTVTSLIAVFNRVLVADSHKIGLIPFLRKAGYQISILSGQDESFGDVAAITGMKSAGNYYFDARTAIDDRVFPSKDAGSLRLSEERVVGQFQRRFRETDFSRPQFFYLNFQAAHFPYSHPKMAKRTVRDFIPRSNINLDNKAWVEASYWNAIANADWAVGEVLAAFAAQDLLSNTTVVILGDHGESLFDDKFLGHGHALNDIQTLIPLVINNASVRIGEPIGQMDVAELAVRSALALPIKMDDPDKTVFQMVGSLSAPALIAHVAEGGIRTLFDFRSERFYFSDLKTWKSYGEAVNDGALKKRATRLLREWEALRWREHIGRKTAAGAGTG